MCIWDSFSWNLLPAESYDGLKYGLDGNEIETYRRFDDEHFVYISGLDKNCSDGENYIIWLRKGKEDKISNIGVEVLGWSTGTSALHIACKDFTCNDYERVYLLGFDHHVDYYANLYTNTEHYFSRDRNMRSEYDNWGEQILKVVKDHPALQFIWVNYLGDNFPNLPNLFSKDEKEICQL